MRSILKVAKNVSQANVLNILWNVEMQLDSGPVRRGPRPYIDCSMQRTWQVCQILAYLFSMFGSGGVEPIASQL